MKSRAAAAFVCLIGTCCAGPLPAQGADAAAYYRRCAGAVGGTDAVVFFPWDEIKGLLKPDGPLARFAP